MKMPVLKALICCAILGVGGCASSQVDPSQYSGFLKDYSRLKPAESATGAPVMRWIDPDVKLSTYSQVYIEPSQFFPRPQPTAVISAQTLQSITRYFDTALQRELGKTLRLASGPGPDTLVLRPAITAVSTRTEGLKPYEVIPIALMAAAVNTAAGGRDQNVEIATEAAFLDADTNKVLAQVVRKGSGTPLENDKTQLTLDAVKPVLDGWANDLRLSVEALKAKQ
ncbi:DUF3313 domain-containing protein [Pseudomonas petrae]|uniref:DUF3313 domain-containing protein n=1 Tax=Pseudomonas petrae TaxID=2912190 RepID=A0ABS9I316_9PSED|nr:DUF3313 domain-containing protein [Pseudomonas petrae]MCF7532387.1 DUF3313 domain-containing protein [Pseudomonas petrae]MCF7541754.1 DUF3313 domain-containing protein [Pseudomonas petrae]MCF7557597.1 DUF3313 domain-containing protein [Pseudomonas petrae]